MKVSKSVFKTILIICLLGIVALNVLAFMAIIPFTWTFAGYIIAFIAVKVLGGRDAFR
jgi:hypothetical protein